MKDFKSMFGMSAPGASDQGPDKLLVVAKEVLAAIKSGNADAFNTALKSYITLSDTDDTPTEPAESELPEPDQE